MPMINFFRRLMSARPAANIRKDFSLENPGPLQAFLRDLLGTDKADVKQPYASNIWVYRAIREWCRIAQLPIVQAGKDGGESRPLTGSLATLIDRPSPGQTREAFVDGIVVDLGTCGESFTRKDKPRNPLVLERVAPWDITYQQNDLDPATGKPMRWRIRHGNGRSEVVPADQIIHGRFLNPYNDVRGLSPLKAAELSLSTDQSARKHNKYMLERHGRVQGVISFTDTIGAEELKRRMDMWREMAEGAENAGKWMGVDSGAKIEQLTQSMKDMDWSTGVQTSLLEICAAFQVPIEVVGAGQKTYSNYETALLSLYQDTLMPLSRMVASTLALGLDQPANSIAFDFSGVAVLQAAHLQRVQTYTQLITQGKVTPEQAAIMTGLNIGTIGEVQRQVWLTMSDTPYSQLMAEPETTPDGEDTEDEPDDMDEDEQIEASRKAILSGVIKIATDEDAAAAEAQSKALAEAKAARSERASRAAKIADRNALPWERKLRVAMREFFAAQSDAINQKLAQVVKREVRQSGQKADIVPRTPAELADEILGTRDWNKALRKKAQPILQAAAERGALTWLAEAGVDTGRFKDAVIYQFLQGQLTIFDKINENTRQTLTAITGDLADMIGAGKSVEDIMAAIEPKLEFTTNETQVRAQRIARTESMRSINGGRYAEMADVGVQYKTWVAIMDSEVRDSHASYDGVTIGMDEEFAPNLAYPGDPRADAGETINCRCTIIASTSLEG